MSRAWLSAVLAAGLLSSPPLPTGVRDAIASPVASPAEPRLVRVRLLPGQRIENLLVAGLDVVALKGGEAQVLEWPGDAATFARLGLHTEVLDEHPGLAAARQSDAELARLPAPVMKRVRSAIRPDGIFRIETAPPFGSGSMGGYWTSDEIKMKLDDLVASDVNDVVASKVDTIGTTVMGRPIWGLKLGKTVTPPDTRPVAFLNALTHAREPEGMQALFYFVDDLLSRYGTDPFATYLLDQRVIYIVPLVNPDGYRANEDTYFGSTPHRFGLWRKNTRDNNGNLVFDSSDGVDINRNYGFKWALNDTGSSPLPGSDAYRGPSAFSEPETRAQRDIVTALRPKTGLSFHSYSDIVVHPWGWTIAPTPDINAFKEWTDELTRDNGYNGGAAPNILYSVNGEFNDWCYGDTLLKPKVFSWTPEIGPDTGNPQTDFWPAPSRIVPLAQENLRPCYVVAAIAGPFVQEDGVTVIEGNLNAGHAASIRVRARNLGATGNAGPSLAGTLTALDAGAYVLPSPVSYPTLGPRQSADPLSDFRVFVDDTVTPGRLLRFQVAFTATGGFYSRDTIAVPAGTPTVLASDNASGTLALWTPGSWGIVSNDPAHLSRYFADSPAGGYPNDANNIMRLNATVNLSAGVHAYAFYETRWQFEENFDAASIEASLDGTTWSRLPATGTTPGSGLLSGIQVNQPAGQPVYAGSRHLWKPERADLSAFTGAAATAVRFRYRVLSDGGNPSNLLFDGFNFDSLRIVIYDPAAQPPPAVVEEGPPPSTIELAAPFPNPARGVARFSFGVPIAGPVRLEIIDLQGRHILTLADGTLAANRYTRGWNLRDESGNRVAPGMYLAQLTGAAGKATRRFVVLQ